MLIIPFQHKMINVYSVHTLPEHLLLPELSLITSSNQPENGVYLMYDTNGLALCKVGEKGRVQVNFAASSSEYRRTKGGGELIAKAVNHSSQPIVWDATGGLGRDAWVLAAQGLNLCVFEQNPSIYALLLDGIVRAQVNPDLSEIANRVQLIYGNATQQMPLMNNKQPDVVYLDPMYPERQKTSAVKKEMAYFHELLGQANTENDASLFQIAKQIAKKRIVVKRPRLGLFLCNEKPAYQYIGKSTRFDVYLPINK